MKHMILILSALILTACGSSGNGSGATGRVDSNLIIAHEYETSTHIWDFQTADLPGNSPTTVIVKGLGACDGRVQLSSGHFTLVNFVGPCSDLNGDYTYYLTTKCQGYAQDTYRCGDTSLIEIVLHKL